MKKQRMLIGAVLTAGLGLTGLVSANASGATAPSAHKTTTATTVGAVSGKGGQVRVCVIKGGPGAGKVTRSEAGKTAAGKTKAGKPVAGKTTIKVVNGKVYVNGKRVPQGKVSTKCKLPPLPPLGPGHKKGIVCIVKIGPGAGKDGKGEAGQTTAGKSTAVQGGRTTVKVVNGKMYVNGKPAPKGKLDDNCPKPPPFSTTGPGAKGGATQSAATALLG